MELRTIALFVAVFAGALWTIGIAVALASGPWIPGLLAALPLAALGYILARLVLDRRRGDPYNDLEE